MAATLGLILEIFIYFPPLLLLATCTGDASLLVLAFHA